MPYPPVCARSTQSPPPTHTLALQAPSHSTGERGTMDGDCGLSFSKLCLGVSALFGWISPYACAPRVSLLDTQNLYLTQAWEPTPDRQCDPLHAKWGVVHAACVLNTLPNPTISLLATALRGGCPNNPREETTTLTGQSEGLGWRYKGEAKNRAGQTLPPRVALEQRHIQQTMYVSWQG